MIGFGFAAGMTAAQKALRVAITVLVLVALLALSYCQGREDGANNVKLEDERARSAQWERAYEAGERAAETRLADQLQQLEMEKQYEDAIGAAPGGANSPAAVALACQRLRRAGHLDSELPIPCRSGSGVHAEAAAGAGDRN